MSTHIKHYEEYVGSGNETGTVVQVNHPLVTIDGLLSVRPHEVLVFEDGTLGQVFSLNKDSVSTLSFSHQPMDIGTHVVRTHEELALPVSETMLGAVINPLGHPLSKGRTHTAGKIIPLDSTPKNISQRTRITEQLRTGVSIIDLLIPIGKGQRQLVIGDRKVGKTSFLLDILQSQVTSGTIAIYAAIGKKKSDIKQLEEHFQKANISDSVVLVATSSSDAPTLIHLTPYAAMSIAEHFRDLGKDTLVIFDDLSTHAKFYREVSLLAKNFPGRDSYPGDIFHAHAKLLERGGNFLVNGKGVSITCIPVVETVEGDFTGYIPTNIMSMTDGHVFFDSNVYYEGRRPAINMSLSVTRVGKQIHTPLERSINRELFTFLNLYEKLQNLSHFGSELTDQMKSILDRGEKFYSYFDQPAGILLPTGVQIVFLAMLWMGMFDKAVISLSDTRTIFTKNTSTDEGKKLLSFLITCDNFNDLLRNVNGKKDELLLLCNENK